MFIVSLKKIKKFNRAEKGLLAKKHLMMTLKTNKFKEQNEYKKTKTIRSICAATFNNR